uniref:Uncharacterized protein n=1 Tax=Sander lucioperca TaxID=283035 RepID=A0A8C9XRQ5_SANLU
PGSPPCRPGSPPCRPGSPPCRPGSPPCRPGSPPCRPGSPPCRPGSPPCRPGSPPCRPGSPLCRMKCGFLTSSVSISSQQSAPPAGHKGPLHPFGFRPPHQPLGHASSFTLTCVKSK